MRLRDETPLDPEVAASLDAIDAVLAGEPVDPRHAELAELALLLADERPDIDTAFATLLDEGVERRFATRQPAPRASRPRRRWLWAPAAGLAAAAGVAVVIVVSSGSNGTRLETMSTASISAKTPAPASAGGIATTAADSALSGAQYGAPARAASTAPIQTMSAPGAVRAATLQPPSTGRKIVQGGQLSLTTAPARVDTVAQEVFDVVGQEHGVVNSSTVTATRGPGGYAQFQLSIPSGALPQAMASLSTLQYARVASRTDSSQDVTDQYNGDATRLADARALRTSLLKQLANATTTAQIDSLTAQIHDAEASISSDLATLRGLNNQINYSQVSLTINGGPTPLPTHGGSGFSLHQAAHDAGRVLTVAAGVALIALAALVPFGLLLALCWWVLAAIRRRRREQALDLA